MIATYEPGLDGPLVAGVDVGGTKTSIVVTDDRDRILYEHVSPTDRVVAGRPDRRTRRRAPGASCGMT